MPELPEVETVVRSIGPLVQGKILKDINAYPGHGRVFEHFPEKDFKKRIIGQTVRGAGRRGKYILLFLDNGVIGIHLRMTGVLKTALTGNDKTEHLAVKIDFQDGSCLFFKDYRKFGRFYFFNTAADLDEFLGPEPLTPSFTLDYLTKGLKTRQRMIKPLLWDQGFLAGLGNIYVDEALWISKIHPESNSSRIQKGNVIELHQAIIDVLTRALSFSGTTFMSFSFEGENKGAFKDYLNVFGRTGSGCSRCGELIKKIKVGQRGTHICPVCQKKR